MNNENLQNSHEIVLHKEYEQNYHALEEKLEMKENDMLTLEEKTQKLESKILELQIESGDKENLKSKCEILESDIKCLINEIEELQAELRSAINSRAPNHKFQPLKKKRRKNKLIMNAFNKKKEKTKAKTHIKFLGSESNADENQENNNYETLADVLNSELYLEDSQTIQSDSFPTAEISTSMSDEQLEPKFWKAVKTNNTRDLEDVYQKGFTNLYVVTKDISKCFPAEKATIYDSIDVLKWLAEKGVDFERQGFPAHTAAYFDKVEIFKYFLDQKVDMDRFDNNEDETPMCSVYEGNIPIIKLLAEKNVDYLSKKCSRGGYTPAFVASMHGKPNVLEFLKNNNIDMKATGVWGAFGKLSNYAHVAAFSGAANVLKFLDEEGVDLEAKDDQGKTPAHKAAEGADGSFDRAEFDTNKLIKVFEFINNKGVDLNTEDHQGDTPAHLAASRGLIEILEFLDTKHVDLKKKNKNKETLAHKAMKAGSAVKKWRVLEVLEFLNKKGVDLNAKDSRGKTAADIAAKKGDTEVLRFLNRRNKLNGILAMHERKKLPVERKRESFGKLKSMIKQKETDKLKNTDYEVPESKGYISDSLKSIKNWIWK
jgi:ankyrin repeat protein